MAGFKRYTQSLDPLCFMSFDSRTQWDDNSGYLVYGETVLDESNYGNHGMLHRTGVEFDEIGPFPSYSMGQTSLIELQQSEQYAIVFGQASMDNRNSFPFEKSYIEIPHNESLKLSKSFTVSFFFNKYPGHGALQNYQWDVNTGKYIYYQYGYSRSYTRPIFRKGLKIGLTYNYPWSSSSSMTFTFPNNSFVSNGALPAGGTGFKESWTALENQIIHCIMTHEYIENEDSTYKTISRVYINGRIWYEWTSNNIYGVYDGSNSSPIEIAGTGGSFDYNYLNDRQTNPLYMDAFTVYDKALTKDQCANLYKKAFGYTSIIKRAGPRSYYDMNEQIVDTTVKDQVNSYHLSIYGSTNQVLRQQPGVHGVYGTSCIKFQDKGMLYRDETYTSSTYFNPTGDYCIEFHAAFDNTSHGIILSIQDDTTPFYGIVVHTNYRNNQYSRGGLQVSVSDSSYISVPEFDVRGNQLFYNDSEFRHYCINKTGSTISLYIDGILIGQTGATWNFISSGGHNIYIGGLMPGNMHSNCKLQHLAFYNKALQTQEILMRVSYLTKYVIKGRITLHGQPIKALIRVYSFNTGELLIQQLTDGSGNYNIDIPSDDYINFVAQQLNVTSVRPRIIGPTMADKYLDSPWDW